MGDLKKRHRSSTTSTATSPSLPTYTSSKPPVLNTPIQPKPKQQQQQQQQQTQPFIQYSTTDVVLISVLTVVAAATRLYRLDHPPAVVFDELHFQKFCDRLLSGTWFFDIHPPLGKLILAFGAYLLGYRSDPSFVIDKIGHLYPSSIKYMSLRLVSCFFSILTVPMTYTISRQLSLSSTSSFLNGTLMTFDFLTLIEGRLILMESQLIFFSQLSLSLALLLWRSFIITLSHPSSSHAHFRYRTLLILTGIACGIALSIKHTALATPGLIAIVSFFGFHFLSSAAPLPFPHCAAAGVTGFLVYAASFYVMFNRLHMTGGKYDNFMPLSFRRTLIDSKDYNVHSVRSSFPILFTYLNRRMVVSNASIKKRHNWESFWYQWIINWRGVLYYTLRSTTSDNVKTKEIIYLFGNPVVVYAVLCAVLVFVSCLVVTVRYRHVKRIRKWTLDHERNINTAKFLAFGWACNLLPYILVDRAAFIYHYIPGLFYGELLVGLLVDLLPNSGTFGGMRTVVCVTVCSACVAAFAYWSPWIYAVALTEEEHRRRRWLPRWT